ncbi:MAG: hypothetical protein ABIV50_06050 [Opitutus sp.]
MKSLYFFITLLLGAWGLPTIGRCEAAATESRRELTIVVVESLGGRSMGDSPYDRIARVFTDVFEERKWPLKIKDERFAANTPNHEIELRVFFHGVTRETPSELTFRGWMVLDVQGEKHDFGMVRYRYVPRVGEQMDEVLDKVVAGAARIAVDKIEPILFPGPASKR